MATLDRKRLAHFVVARRMELGITDRRALSKLTSISDRTIGKLELGQPVSQSTLGMVENVLGWEPGSAQRTLEGGTPAVKDSEQGTPQQQPAYSDPVLQQIWELDLPESVRRGMIAFAEASREQEGSRRTG